VKKIYQYGPLTSREKTEVSGKPIFVGTQEGEIYVWAEHYTDRVIEDSYYILVGTGWDYDSEYFGSAIIDELVWHVIKV
jgi:hypothetical protein